MKYRVFCQYHQYDTATTIDSKGTAISAARMHAMLPCRSVQVQDERGHDIPWRSDPDGPTLDRR